MCDYSKGVAASVNCPGDYWKEYWLEGHNPDAEQKILSVACILTMAYYRRAMEKGRAKFERFARNVWGVNTAEEGLEALRNWMLELGIPTTITEIGATPEMIDGIVSTTEVFPAGYLDLKPEDIKEILTESL